MSAAPKTSSPRQLQDRLQKAHDLIMKPGGHLDICECPGEGQCQKCDALADAAIEIEEVRDLLSSLLGHAEAQRPCSNMITEHDLQVQSFIREKGWCGAFTMGGSHVCILPRGHKPAEHCAGVESTS